MMEQYLAVKKQHPDKIVFFQVGEFYEVFLMMPKWLRGRWRSP